MKLMKIIGVDENFEIAHKFGRGKLANAKAEFMELVDNNRDVKEAVRTLNWKELIAIFEANKQATLSSVYICMYYLYLLASVDTEQANKFLDCMLNQYSDRGFRLYGLKLDKVELINHRLPYSVMCSKIKELNWQLAEDVEITQALLQKELTQTVSYSDIDKLVIYVSDITADHMSEQEIIDWLGINSLEILDINQVKIVEN